MNQDEKLHVALGIVVILILLLSVFTFGWIFGDSKESTNTNQLLVVNSFRTTNQAQESGLKTTNQAQQPVQETKTTPNLGQSLTEQQRQNIATTNNNIEINVHNTGYSGSRYNYYPRYYRSYSPYRTRYYNGYHPYYKHSFSYSTSYGNSYRYSYY